MIETLLIPILTSLGGLGVGAWFFGGKQKHSRETDNESHQREKEFFDLVDQKTEKETNKLLGRITKCAKHCSHSATCPILIQWDDENSN